MGGWTGLNWLQEHLLPWESEEKQEKNTVEGYRGNTEERDYHAAPSPREVKSLRPTDG